MKKTIFIIYALLLCALVSCSKEERVTTYTFKYNVYDISGVVVNITLFEYNDIGEKIGTNSIINCTYGTTKLFTAKHNAVKVKVYMNVTAGSSEIYKWVQQVYYLEADTNLDIDIENDTMIGGSEP
ncbi:MAG: hypothetical protein SOZ00_07900 [Tidjanibacter sp.]|nr:hypothetical protein [Tidjanibacter sp.]